MKTPTPFDPAEFPRFGRIEEFNRERGFGFVLAEHSLNSTSASRERLFFHIAGREPTAARHLDEELRGRPIVFRVGKSVRTDREEIVRWCTIDHLQHFVGSAPHSQFDWDALLVAVVKDKDLETLIQWLESLSGPDGESAMRLPRKALVVTALVQKLQGLAPSEWRRLDIAGRLRDSALTFRDAWRCDDDNYVPRALMSSFDPPQLAEWGAPRYRWLSKVKEELHPKLFEWALRSSQDPAQQSKWERNLSDRHSWESEVAGRLIASDWTPSAATSEWLAELASLGRLSAGTILSRLERCPAEWRTWIEYFSPSELQRWLRVARVTERELVALARSAPSPELAKGLVLRRALAVDLETDSNTIWEIGVAGIDGRALLLARDGGPDHLSSGLAGLRERLESAMLVVGHNIIRWDWPILERHLGDARKPILWDTLLVGFMLAPYRPTHALGGSHRADEDASDTFAIFEAQLRALGSSIASKLLDGTIESTTALVSAIAAALSSIKWALPATPGELVEATTAYSNGAKLLASRSFIRKLGWVSGVCVVVPDQGESLPVEHLVVDRHSLEASSGPSGDPYAIALCGVLRKSEEVGLQVRLAMLPIWVRQGDVLDSAIRHALKPGSATGSEVQVAGFPSSEDWYSRFNRSPVVFIDPNADVLMIEGETTTPFKVPDTALRDALSKPNRGRGWLLYHTASSRADGLTSWATVDQAARKLDSSGACIRWFRTFALPPGADVAHTRAASPNATTAPTLLRRDVASLYPGAEDQATYWQTVVHAVNSLARQQPTGTVTLLLVRESDSSGLAEKLREGLEAVGCYVPAHQALHARAEQLRRASHRPGSCVVGHLADATAWIALASALRLNLSVVVESLPLEEWYAASWQADASKKSGVASVVSSSGSAASISELDALSAPEEPEAGLETDSEDDAEEPDTDGSSDVLAIDSTIRFAAIATSVPLLVDRNLRCWLVDHGFDTLPNSIVVLDPRIDSRRKWVQKLFAVAKGGEEPPSPGDAAALESVFEPLRLEREAVADDYESMRHFFEQNWNPAKDGDGRDRITDFKPSQRPAIDVIRERTSDVLVTLPTGEGKSVLFQVPALCRGLRSRRLTIVVSPLRALMRDQVESLGKLGFHESVDYLSGDRPQHENEDVMQGILDHRLVLVYVAPERFRSRRFVDMLDRRFESDEGFEYLVIDEAHCVSQWGYDFRPDYLYAMDVMCRRYRDGRNIAKSPFILLSATVTESTRVHLQQLINVSSGDDRALPFVRKPDEYRHPIRDHIKLSDEHTDGAIAVRPRADWPIAPRLEHICNHIERAQANRKRSGQSSAMLVFVPWREHAERVAALIRSKIAGCRVEYFHAGLDAESREDAYRRYRDGELDVLVATKAFGMGMDIPHIHWAIHLAPPTYLEDYLQEVGRIGRGEAQLARSGLGSLDATLLHSAQDFESNRVLFQRSRIESRHIGELDAAIHAAARFEGEVGVVVMPDAGFEPAPNAAARRFRCVQVRRILYWLERLDRVKIAAMAPGLMPVTLHRSRLAEVASSESGPVSEVARLLCSLFDAPAPLLDAQTQPPSASGQVPRSGKSLLDRVLDGIGSLFGLRTQRPEGAPAAATGAAIQGAQSNRAEVHDIVDAVIQLDQIWARTSLTDADSVLSTLSELEGRQALRISRTVSFARKRLFPQPAPFQALLFSGVRKITTHAIGQIEASGECILDLEILAAELESNEAHGLTGDYRGVLQQASFYLLRSCGVRIRERSTEQGREMIARMSARSSADVRARVEATLSGSAGLLKQFKALAERDNREIEVSALLATTRKHSVSQRFSERDLRRCLILLSRLQLVSLTEPLVPMSHVLEVRPGAGVLREESHPEVWEELRRSNRMSELRADALEIYVHLPKDLRRAFIDGYFEQATPEALEAFLNEQLGFIEEDGELDTFVAEKRDQLRAKAVDELFARYRGEKPEEPNQWLTISHPHRRNLLVNAGPGAGKTSVLIARIAHLIRHQHLRPEEILVLAFNRAVVSEIRARVRELFKRLGYGALVRRLNVYTFHAFALRSLGARDPTNVAEDAVDDLRLFRSRLQSDQAFRTDVGGGLRAVLVDEFQDMNEDRFAIVKSIAEAGGASTGVMAIGDDDQDIMRWDRSDGAHGGSYFQRFRQEMTTGEGLDELTLSVNFRSGPEIVEASDRFIGQVLRNEDPGGRLKTAPLRAASTAAPATFLHLGNGTSEFDTALVAARQVLEDGSEASAGSAAVLCRTNAEVARAFRALRTRFPSLRYQSGESYRLSQLRHIASFLDLVRAHGEKNGNEPLTRDLGTDLLGKYGGLDVTEVQHPDTAYVTPEELWDICIRESSFATVRDLMLLIETTDTSELDRIRERSGGSSQAGILVSTMHKVKGLEFDRVVVLPSEAPFPFGRRERLERKADAARLAYVAMTRARKMVQFHRGPREAAWISGKSFEGASQSGKLLEGTLEEVRIGWAWMPQPWNADPWELDGYLRSKVAVGDRLTIGGKGQGFGRALFHESTDGARRQIGFLADGVGAGSYAGDLSVKAVLRRRWKEQDRKFGTPDPRIESRGWGLVVLAEGVLR